MQSQPQRPGAACPNCRILLNSGKCPKCGLVKVRRVKNLAGRWR